MTTDCHPEDIDDLHQAVDLAVAEIETPLRALLNCKVGCHDCCVDDITVFEVEAQRIREQAGDVLKQMPHAVGKCAFLDEAGQCRIYHVRPYVCRTQGLPLMWVEEEGDEWLAYRDICPLNDEVPIETMNDEACWQIGPFEGQLANLQQREGALKRVALRDLFEAWTV